MRKLIYGSVLAAVMAISVPSLPGQEPVQPDNTKVNKRDRAKDQPTADQQKENKTDREIAREIRSAVVGDKSLSTYAHNVKIIAQHGTVTLKGPVRSEEEKKNIVEKATQVAGSGKVTDQLSIKPDKSASSADRAKP